MSQIYYIHSENFDLCRICMLKPEDDRNVKFTRIFPVDDGEDFTLHRQIEEMFGDKIEKDDIKPKIICENCQNAMSAWLEIKQTFAESAIVINHLAESKFTPPTTSNARPNSSQNSNNEETPTRVQPETKKTKLLPFNKRIEKNKFECKTGNMQNIRLPSSYKLFTCLRPSCNFIFHSFGGFKFHYREHFACKDKKMCWVCFLPFSNLSELRQHKVRNCCRTPGKFKCYECSEKFDDLEYLSIHKFTFHNSHLVSRKNNEKTIKCAFCQKEIVIHAFKNHLHKFH